MAFAQWGKNGVGTTPHKCTKINSRRIKNVQLKPQNYSIKWEN